MQVRGTFPELNSGMRKSGKVHKVLHEFKEGTLHSGSKRGPKVTSRKQAVAIALEARQPRRNSGHYSHHEGGMAGFSVRRAPKQLNNPRTFAGRRAASHRKAYGK